MNDDELRARLEAADPARHDVPAASWIDELVEATVSGTEQETARRRNGWVLGAAAAAVVAALGVGGYAVLADDDGGGSDEPTTLALTLPKGDPMMMCIALSPEELSRVDQAFSGTATEVGDRSVTIETDHWYKGGDADLVTLETSGDEYVLLEGGIEFAEGERYLVSASLGTVGSCGFSGVWTEELAGVYAEAFGS